MSKTNVFQLRNDAKKIFKKTSYDRKNPLQFTFTISQLKALASWASPTGKSKDYLRSPFIPANKNQAAYKAELRGRLITFLNGDVAKQVPDNKLIDIRYLMESKTIQAFETLLMWAGYHKIGTAPTKGELRDLVGRFAILKDKYPPIDPTNENHLAQRKSINGLIDRANKELDSGSKDNNTGVMDVNTFYILKQEVHKLSNINTLKRQWATYQAQSKQKKQHQAALEQRHRQKKQQAEKAREKGKEEEEEKKQKQADAAIAAKEKSDAENTKKDDEYTADAAHNTPEAEKAALNNRNIDITQPIAVSPNKDFAVQATIPTEDTN